MNYTDRTIFKDVDEDGKFLGYYRYIGREVSTDEETGEETVITEGTRLDTTSTGDVWIEIPTSVFDADLPEEMKATIEAFYPSLGQPEIQNEGTEEEITVNKVYTLRDVFLPQWISKDDESTVCFKTGIYNKTARGGYTRPKKTSDYEFDQFVMSMVAEDLSNVSKNNPYQEDVL